jgi:hypothetical protein
MQTSPPSPSSIPLLHNGDRLDRDEFHRRYSAMPPSTRAELIEGVVYMPSPVRQDHHSMQHSHLVTCAGVYRAATPGVEVGSNPSLILDVKNMPQPDVVLYITPQAGGRAHVNDDGYLVDGPEWIAEVSASTVSFDLHDKLEAYHRNGVREYVVWRVEDKGIDCFILRDGKYEVLPVGPEGILRSEVFPGLWLDCEALLNGDLARVLDVVGRGTRSAEHAEFLRQLASNVAR